MNAPISADEVGKIAQAFGARFLLYLFYLVYAPVLPLMTVGADHYTMVPMFLVGAVICGLDIWVSLATTSKGIALRAGASWVLSLAVSISIFLVFNASYRHAYPLDFDRGSAPYISIAMWAAIMLPIWGFAAWRGFQPNGKQRMIV